jgi:hypothetical protein
MTLENFARRILTCLTEVLRITRNMKYILILIKKRTMAICAKNCAKMTKLLSC